MNPQPHPLSLLDRPISTFAHTQANIPDQETTLRRIVSTAYYQSQIEEIRAEPNEGKQKALKEKLRAFSPVALLYHRKADTSFDEKINKQWPMLMGDIDQKDNPGVSMAELKTHLCRLPYILLCSYSVRGGLWFVMRLPDQQTPETLAAHFRYVQKLFSQYYGIKLDASKGGNPCHLRYVSFDPAPYFNDDALVMDKMYTPSPPKLRSIRKTSQPKNNGQLVARLAHFVESAQQGQRHEKLLKASITAGGYVAAGRIEEETAVYALETVASEWPTFSKSQKTIRDGIKLGRQRPIYTDNLASDIRSFASIQPTPVFKPAVEVREIQTDPIKVSRSQVERLLVETNDPYLTEWDSRPELTTKPVKRRTFYEWQQQDPYFGQMGLASLKTNPIP